MIKTVHSDAIWLNMTELQEMANYINWTYYINAIFEPDWSTDIDDFRVNNPVLLSNVSALILSSDKRTLANYIGWTVVATSKNLLTDVRVRSRWEYCIAVVKNYFGLGVSALYVQNTTREEKKQQTSLVLQIMNYIQKSFIESLETSFWMDDEAKLQAINKTRKITAHVGYPSELLNDTVLNDYYDIASVFRKLPYLFNILILRQFYVTAMYSKAGERRIKGE